MLRSLFIRMIKITPFYPLMKRIYYKRIKDKKWDQINQKNIIIDNQNSDSQEQRRVIEQILIPNDKNSSCYDLHKYFINNRERVIDKWLHYFDLYEKHFSKYRERDVNILEIGIQNGGSTQMWKEYFSKNKSIRVNIYGLDIDPRCKAIEETWIHEGQGGGGNG